MTIASQVVTARLAPRDVERIDALVDEGEFQSRSDLLRFAVKTTLTRFAHRGDPLAELDDLDLPALEGLPSLGEAGSEDEAASNKRKATRQGQNG